MSGGPPNRTPWLNRLGVRLRLGPTGNKRGVFNPRFSTLSPTRHQEVSAGNMSVGEMAVAKLRKLQTIRKASVRVSPSGKVVHVRGGSVLNNRNVYKPKKK